MSTVTAKSHPIFVIAAIALILFSVVGIGAITGLIPSTFSKSQSTDSAVAKTDAPATPQQAPLPAPVAESAPAPTVPPATTSEKAAAPVEADTAKEPAPAPKPRPSQTVAKKPHAPAHKATASEPEQVAVNEPAPPAPAPMVCRECGVIEAINTVELPGQGSGLGAVAGGVLGGVLGHQVGGGRGKDVATVAGAIGGAVAGHQIEKSTKKKVQYDVVVRLEDNTAQTVHLQSDPGLRVGEHVKLVDGQIVRN